MGEFFKSYGTLILAVYAVVQVWIVFLWKRFVRKGKLKIHETGTIEIGYSNYGPTIALNGTLRGLHQAVFVREIQLLVTRDKDSSAHKFQWLAFRSPELDLTASTPVSLEIPSGFMVIPSIPHRYNIIFNDTATLGEIRPLYDGYLSAWNKTIEKMNEPLTLLQQLIDPNKVLQNKVSLIQKFQKSQATDQVHGSIERLCYWDTGKYKLTMTVYASDPNMSFSKTYAFSISEQDSISLRANVIPVLELPISAHLQIEEYPFYFTYAQYAE